MKAHVLLSILALILVALFANYPCWGAVNYTLIGTDPDDMPIENINQIYIASDAGKVYFKITSYRNWGSDISFGVYLDTDQNLNTGDEYGSDYVAVLFLEQGVPSTGLGAYNAALEDFVYTDAILGDLIFHPNSSSLQFSILLSDMGNPSAFDFDVCMWVEDLVDCAPEEGIYTYKLSGQIPGGGASIFASPSIVKPGEDITVTYAGAPGNDSDWIGIYAVSASDGNYIGWYYLHGNKSGTLKFTAPTQTGDYNFRMFPTDAYEPRLAVSNIVTVSGEAPPTTPGTSSDRYRVINEAKTWKEAKAYAESLGGHLVTISSEQENKLVYDLTRQKGITGSFWIGLTDETKEGTFVWVTNEPLIYTNWYSGEPNNYGDEDYVEVGLHAAYKWNDRSGSILNPFVVEFEGIAPPSGTSSDRYRVVNEAKTWKEAKAYAESLGGHLVTISSEQENKLVYDLTRQKGITGSFWIGLTDEAKEGTFVWVTNEPLIYTNWYSGEPNNAGEEDCVEMALQAAYKWNDRSGSILNPFVVEFEGIAPPDGGITPPVTGLNNVEIAICTHPYWISQAATDREANEIVSKVKGSVKDIKIFTTKQLSELASWVTSHTSDGKLDVLILTGTIPDTIYTAGNKQPDGSIAEKFLEAGNMIINTGDYMFYISSPAGVNSNDGLNNMMDRKDTSMWNGGDMKVTSTGRQYLPSLKDFSTGRTFDLNWVKSPWTAEAIFASDTNGKLADPAVIKDTSSNGRLAIFYQASGDDLPRGEVISEFILNWLPTITGGSSGTQPPAGGGGGTTPPVAGRSLVIPEVTATPGQNVTVPINIGDATSVAGAEIRVTYDTSFLTIREVRVTSLSSGLNLTPNINTPGVVILVLASSSGLSGGSGSLVDMIFTVSSSATAGKEALVQFTKALVYDASLNDILFSTQDGKVKIGSTCVKGDVFLDGDVNAKDAILTLQFAAGLKTPTEREHCAANMDDSKEPYPSGITAKDAILILKEAAKASPGMGLITFNDRNISIMLADAYGMSGESISVPLEVDKEGILAGGDIRVMYDSSVLRAEGVSAQTGMMLESNIAEPGVVRMSFASAEGMKGKALAWLRFHVLSDQVSPLRLEQTELYSLDVEPLVTRVKHGRFTSWLSKPEKSTLFQNFPNPFNPETWIPYQLREEGDVVIQIHSVSGELVRELNLGYKPAGLYTNRERAAYWDGKNEYGEAVSSGVYFYSIRAGEFSTVKKMIILR